MSFLFPEILTTEQKLPLLKDYEYDLDQERFTGRILSGKEAVKQWIQKALLTGRYRYLIYDWDYGHELDNLVERNYSQELILSEAERFVKETLFISDYITGVTDFKAELTGSKLIISFTANTVYGNVELAPFRY